MIKTKRLKISLLEEEHLEDLRKMRNDPTTNHWLTDITPISKEAQKEWFKKIQLDKSKMYLVIEKPHKENIVGITMPTNSSTLFSFFFKTLFSKTPDDFVGILRSDKWDRINRSVRIGIDIASKYRGQGYGTEAFGAFIEYLFKQQNINRVWFLVAEKNKVAQKLYKKLGFKQEGKQREALFRDGKYHSYLMFSMLKKEWSSYATSFIKATRSKKRNE